MPLSNVYVVKGIIADSCDRISGHKRKRLAVQRPGYNTTKEYDINPNTPYIKGAVLAQAKNVLGVPLSDILIGAKLALVLKDK